MKASLLLLLTFVPFCYSIEYTDTYDTQIPWEKERTLTWADFEGELSKEDLASNYAAVTSAKIIIESHSRNGILSFRICNLFLKKESAKSKENSNYQLNHEQMHFNISEIFARRIRKAVDSLSSINAEKDLYWNEIEYLLKEREKYQILFDEETEYGESYHKQRQWDQIINSELETLNMYYIPGENGSCACI